MNRGDSPFAIDQKSGGQRVDAAIKLGGLVVAHEDAVIHAEPGDEGLDRVPTFVVHGDAEDGETMILVAALEVHEPGDLHGARLAPGGPEIEEHDFAAVIGEADGAAIGVLESEIGGGFAVPIGLDGGGRIEPGGGRAGAQQERERGDDSGDGQRTERIHTRFDYIDKARPSTALANQARRCLRRRAARVNSAWRSTPE